MFKWLKKLKSIVREYDLNLQEIRDKIKEVETLIGDRTTISADLGDHDPSYVIVVGRYANKDYVQLFRLETNEMTHIVRILKGMSKYGRVLRIDAPPAIRAIVERKLNESGYA